MKEIIDKQASYDLLTDGMMGTGEVPALPRGWCEKGSPPLPRGNQGGHTV